MVSESCRKLNLAVEKRKLGRAVADAELPVEQDPAMSVGSPGPAKRNRFMDEHQEAVVEGNRLRPAAPVASHGRRLVANDLVDDADHRINLEYDRWKCAVHQVEDVVDYERHPILLMDDLVGIA